MNDSVAAQRDAGFIPAPTPGSPITGLGAGRSDEDLDRIANDVDNCATFANTDQSASDIGDVSCDGKVTGFMLTGGLFSRGTWGFHYEWVDKQLNISASSPTCTLEVQ